MYVYGHTTRADQINNLYPQKMRGGLMKNENEKAKTK